MSTLTLAEIAPDYPFCSPDWDDSAFVTMANTAFSLAPRGTESIDFPCNMKIETALALPIIAAVLALVFVAVLYYGTLLPSPMGPTKEEELNYTDPHGENPATKKPWTEKDYPDDACAISKEEQLEIGRKMNQISNEVQRGATAFLKAEYTYLAGFVSLMSLILLVLFTVDSNRVDRTDGIRMMACFIIGAVLSATAGWIGMKVATDANVRTTQAARKARDGGSKEGGLNNALRVAFTGGAVMGFVVVGLGLFGLSIMMIIMSQGRMCSDFYRDYPGSKNDVVSCWSPSFESSLNALAGFGFGASSIALFARVAGGIYTKAADVGADLVGKVEEDIPEDSPENPATIADNVGDNVGDVAGMGADLFESFVGSIIATATLANGDIAKITFPFWLAAVGVVASICGFYAVSIGEEKEYRLTLDRALAMEELADTLFVDSISNQLKYPYFLKQKDKENKNKQAVIWREDQAEDPEDEKHISGSGPVFDDNAQQADLMLALHKGTITSALLVCVFSAVVCYFLFDYSDYQGHQEHMYGGETSKIHDSQAWRLYGCVLIGLLCGILIGLATEYCTSYSYYPVKSIATAGTTGPATVIIQGLGVGMMSCLPPTVIIVATILACNALMGNYGVAVAAVSMLSTLGITLATDAYGPVADNAGGLAEMVEELPGSVRSTTDALDALGNTTAATGKGFAIGSAVLTSLSLLNAFKDRVEHGGTSPVTADVTDSIVLAGVVFGSMLPFLFGALTMVSVGLAAQELIRAVREDFKIKKQEERDAINASAATPYKPWDYMADKLAGDDLADFGTDTFKYYEATVGGHPGDRKKELAKFVQEFDKDVPSGGFNSITLSGVVKMDGNVERAEDSRATGIEAHDVVDGARWHNSSVHTAQQTVSLAGLPLSKERTESGRWEERQSIFQTKAWQAVRGWAPDSNRCIAISTKASINEMILPGVYAIFIPVFVGFLVGSSMLLGVLAGSIGAGAMMAIMMSNAGGAWDNSKKYIEIAGAHGGKGTEIHKSCVVGDTVGDPFKDTSGPALNILLKLMAVVSLTISSILQGWSSWELSRYSPIPALFILGATFYYCKYVYGVSEKNEPEPEESLSPGKKRKELRGTGEEIQNPVGKVSETAPAEDGDQF